MKKIANIPKLTGGFTLIELLVTIAIIGILSSVIFISLTKAQGKAKDAKVRGGIAQMRAQFEMNFTNSNYSDLTGDPSHIDTLTTTSVGHDNLVALQDDILTQIGNGATFGDIYGLIIYSNATGVDVNDYGIYASTTDGYACIDSFGNTNPNGTGLIPTWAQITAPATKLCQ